MTKDQLEEELKRVKGELKQTNEALEKKEDEIYELKAKDEGWLITSPNVRFDGDTAGIKFKNGQAFVAKKRVYKQFALEPYKEDLVEKMEKDKDDLTKTAAERRAYDAYVERQTTLTSELAVETLVRDFGYTAEFFSVERLDQLDKQVDARVHERAKAEEDLQRMIDAGQIMTPHVMG